MIIDGPGYGLPLWAPPALDTRRPAVPPHLPSAPAPSGELAIPLQPAVNVDAAIFTEDLHLPLRLCKACKPRRFVRTGYE